jgi:hypothetical protein
MKEKVILKGFGELLKYPRQNEIERAIFTTAPDSETSSPTFSKHPVSFF